MALQRFIIVDDHPLFRGALRLAIGGQFPGADIVEAGSLDELEQRLAVDPEIDLVLLDLLMPGVQGFSGLLFLRTQHPGVPVVIVSANGEPQTIRRAMAFGASGFVPKSEPVEHIRDAICRVLDGEIWTPPGLDVAGATASDEEATRLAARLSSLTPQQVRVLMMLGEGLLNKQIAFKLSVSEATIKAHVSAILQKLGVDSRTQAAIAISRIDGSEWRRMDS